MKFFLKYFVISFLIFTLIFTPAIALYDRYIGDKKPQAEKPVQEESPKEPVELANLPLLVDESNLFFETFQEAKNLNLRQSSRINILIFGKADQMTDTIMVASIDTENKFIDLISVPRDTRYEREKYKEGANQKINAVYTSEGTMGLAAAVSKVLGGLPLNYYIAMEYDGLAEIVDSMGGVPMDVKQDMHYKDLTPGHELIIDIDKGYQILDGDHAMQFLRYRSGYVQGDLGRIQAQQEFMKSAMKQALGLRLPVVAATVVKNVETDISASVALSLASKAFGTGTDSIEGHQMPGEGRTKAGLSYIFPDQEGIEAMIQKIYFEPGRTATQSAVTQSAATE